MTRRFDLLGFTFATIASMACAPPAAAQTDPVAAFYRGRTVQAVVGYTPGSTFEFYLRIFVRHLGRHVPGNPNIVVQHMPGAGSLKATAYLASIAPRDGSVIGIINPVTTIDPLIDPKNLSGPMLDVCSTCAFWSKDLRTLGDLNRRTVVVGSTGPSSGSTVDARVLGALAGINFKVVPGYPGLTEVRLAAERGEVDGHCGLQVSAIKTVAWDDFKSGRIAVPVQMGLEKHVEFPDIPNAYDLATKEDDRALFRLIFGPWAYGRPLLAPPEVPKDRVAALRAAFVAAVSAEAAQHKLDHVALSVVRRRSVGKNEQFHGSLTRPKRRSCTASQQRFS